MMTAAITTQGVYTFANLVIKRSIFGLLAGAFPWIPEYGKP